MTITPSALLSLPVITTGTESGLWGDYVNNGLTQYLDIAIAGQLPITITTADVTLTKTSGTNAATGIVSTTAQYAILNISGAKTAARNLNLPITSKSYIIHNAGTGGFLLTVRGVTPTTGITLVDGEMAVVAWNGTDFVKIATNLAGVPSINGGQLAGLRNRIINGNMGIFQRGTTAVTTTAGYGPADRWRTDVVGDTFSTTQGSFVSGDTLYDTGSAQYFTQIAVTSVANTANYCTWQQQIEDVRVLAGQTVTVSFWAKAASGTPSIAVEIVQVFGTGGSPSANVTGTGQAQALTTTWTKYSKTFTVPSINSKTIGTDPNTSATVIEFWLDAGATYNTRANSIGQVSKTVSIAQVQTEIGSVATTFEQRPYGMELALCQRYYNVIGSRGGDLFLYQAASQLNAFVATIAYPVTMRTTPATTTITGTATYTNASALAIVATADYVALRCSVTAAGVYSVSTYGVTNSAEL